MIRGFISNVGRPRAARDLELAKSNLVNHLYTRKRSRVMMPEFGFIVWDVFMDLIASNTRQTIQDDLINIVNSYPYFELLDLNISEFDHGYNIDLRLKYVPLQNAVVLELAFDQRTVI